MMAELHLLRAVLSLERHDTTIEAPPNPNALVKLVVIGLSRLIGIYK